MRHAFRLTAALIAAGTLAAGCGGNKAANNSATANGMSTTTTTTDVNTALPPLDANMTGPTGNMTGGNGAMNNMLEKDLRTNDRDTNLANGL